MRRLQRVVGGGSFEVLSMLYFGASSSSWGNSWRMEVLQVGATGIIGAEVCCGWDFCRLKWNCLVSRRDPQELSGLMRTYRKGMAPSEDGCSLINLREFRKVRAEEGFCGH